LLFSTHRYFIFFEELIFLTIIVEEKYQKTMNTKVPTSYWAISVLALLWNLMGCLAYLTMQFLTPEMMEGMPEAERAILEGTPAWVTTAFAVAVWFGLFGCILLLLRKALALPIFIISVLGIAVQQIGNIIIVRAMETFEATDAIMPIAVLLIGIYLIIFSRKAKTNNWIN